MGVPCVIFADSRRDARVTMFARRKQSIAGEAPSEPWRVTRYDVGNRLGLLSSEECKAGRFAYFVSRAAARTEMR
jgi:hypothetical protein